MATISMSAANNQATANTQAAPAVVGAYDASTTQFGELLDHLVTQLNHLFSLTTEVAKLQKGERLKFPTGQEIGKREVRSLQSQFAKEFKGLKKYFAAAKKPKKNNRTRRPFTGFGMPIYIDSSLREFFKRADLGPIMRPTSLDAKGNPVECDSDGTPLKEFLSLILDTGITARGMLTPLFNIYVRVNQMPYTDGNRTYLRATPEMREFFARDFEELRRKDEEEPRQETVTIKKPNGEKEKKKVPIAPFDPARFRYSDIMRILSYHWVPAEQLSPEEIALLSSPEVRERLVEEQHIVSDTNACYRAQEAPARKQQRADRRHSQAPPKN